jgi:hypothetical protein
MFRINETNYQATVAKVQKINQRAQKRGFTGHIILDAQRVVVESLDEFGFDRTEIWFDVELGGEAASYNGWTFQATLAWDEAAGLVVRSAPGADPVDRSQLEPNHCDHCRTDRFRKETYVVRNVETGEQLQVGSTCIKDFLGWTGSIVFLDTETLGEELGFGGYGGAADRVGTEYATAVAWALIKLDGYKPASSYGSTTKGDVLDVLFPPKVPDLARRIELARIQALAAEAKDQAAACIAWVLSDDFTGASDYVQNLKNIVGADSVSFGNIGLLASAPQAWARWQQKTLIREAEAAQVSDWLGDVGKRITFTATVRAITYIPGDFGTTVLYSMLDAAGNIIKWFASREALGDQVGETYTLKATIKAQDTFKDVKQTLVTRAKVQA